MNILKFLNRKGHFVNEPTYHQIVLESLELESKMRKNDIQRKLLAQGRNFIIEETDEEFIIREVD